MAATAAMAGGAVVGLGAAPAMAHDGDRCDRVRVETSTDGGATWSTTGRFTGEAPTTISVRLSGRITEGCEYPISLASYQTDGPSWESSGEQVFLGWDTTVLTSETKEDVLDVSAYAPSCFGQIDLYGNDTKYDGTNGNALPHFPDSATPTDLIAAWNGEAPCEEGEETPPPAEEPTEEPTDEEVPTEEPTDEEVPTEEPTDEEVPAEEPTEEAPADEPDDEAPAEEAPVDEAAAEPVGEPEVAPVSTTPHLAETGGDGSQMTLYASAGAALLVAGGAAVFIAKRRGTRTSA
ncbi:LAETG motif-containing sortase-dependent surface protein [Streptomyces sp. RFCAC02]|uniref:LAETG motif-containing sortase-dependent surface protein n=1 Tax=Streptomyces sp. RFCAC02 TaxID=2499143 RepID=UPI001021A3E3|nr:LAETG motif-containing sortase-dependent surface protein [Streptomyces sp. RFCAC02]